MVPLHENPVLTKLFGSVFSIGNDDPDHDPDTLTLIKLIRKLRQDTPELAVVEAQRYVYMRDIRMARQTLEQADAQYPNSGGVKAMLALVLMSQGDGLWAAYADDARNVPTQSAEALTILRVVDRASRGESHSESEDAPIEADSPGLDQHALYAGQSALNSWGLKL